jgi:hypothetical protein
MDKEKIRVLMVDLKTAIEKLNTGISSRIGDDSYMQYMGLDGEGSRALNNGDFVINKAPENITTEDIINAYQLDDFSEGWPVIDEGMEYPDTEFIVTGEKLGLIPDLYERNVIDGQRKAMGDSLKINGETVNCPSLKSYLTTEQILAMNGLGITDYTLKGIGIYNQRKIRQIIEDNTLKCSGLKLRHIYAFYYEKAKISDTVSKGDDIDVQSFQKEGEYTNLEGTTYLEKVRINLPRDFIIDGEVDGKAVGGIFTRWGAFNTRYSLYLKKMVLMKNDGQYPSFVVIARPKSITVEEETKIDQLRVEGCFFHGISSTSGDPNGDPDAGSFYKREGYSYAGNYIKLVFDHRVTPVKSYPPRVYKGGNVINHVYIANNNIYGSLFLDSHTCRFNNTYRVVNNNFYGGGWEDNKRAGYRAASTTNMGRGGEAISHSIDNDASPRYSPAITYYSCPKWFSGNNFYGADRILAKRILSVNYYSGLMLEGGNTYVLNNVFKNYVCKETIAKGFSDGAKIHRTICATYDAYASVPRLYYANNTCVNIFAIGERGTAPYGVLKGKGPNIPYSYMPDFNYYQLVRYYSHNKFLIDEEWLERRWREDVESGWIYDIIRDSQKANYRIEDEVDENGNVLPADTAEETYKYGERTVDAIIGENLYDYLSLKFDTIYGETMDSAMNVIVPMNQYVYKNNLVDMGRGCVGGMKYNDEGRAVHLTIKDNTFIGRRMSSNRWRNLDRDKVARKVGEALFTFIPWDKYKAEYIMVDGKATAMTKNGEAPTITITGNSFVVGDFVSGGVVLPTEVKIAYGRIKYGVSDFFFNQKTSLPLRENVNISDNTINDQSAEQTALAVYVEGSKSKGEINQYYEDNPSLP